MRRGCNDCVVGPVVSLPIHQGTNLCNFGSTAPTMLFPFLGHSHCLGR